ncbi:MAG: crossover junction endodeoxyribonuclease RuvC [Gammaproteobacteria bacterium]|nr:crossover junction endodeoxyribonuclease RuvC [Gammaproteobacteria bacterium]
MSAEASRILGIDPGSRITGYGIIDVHKGGNGYVASGCIRTAVTDMPRRLLLIHEGLETVLARYQPDATAIEQIYVHRNAGSALKLGQARGGAILTAMLHQQPVFEYSPSQIKQAVVGSGRASKEQVQHMVRHLLGLSEAPQEDAADALAVALCHGNTEATFARLPQIKVPSGRRWR